VAGDPAALAWVTLAFVLAGTVKGVIGMGLPLVAMGALGLVMAPVQAAALLVVPSLVTNLWQMAAGASLGALSRRLASLLIGVAGGTALGIGFLTGGRAQWASLALGAALAVYALAALALPAFRVPLRQERRWSPLIGLVTGVLTGATGVFSVPAVPYLSALGLAKEDLIQALGLSFTVSTLALAAGLWWTGRWSVDVASASALAVLPALAGLWLGQRLRDRLDAVAFRRWFLSALMAIGLFMMARAGLAA
jgi:uncharacterized protein